MFTPEQGDQLLKLARSAIAERFGSPPAAMPQAGWLMEPTASFVTLIRHEQLRGCIGSLEAYRPLAEDVMNNAVAAAFCDSRFPPLRVAELKETHVEVSLLSQAVLMDYSDERDVLKQLDPGKDGVILEWGLHRATFLPQVWESLPQPQHFMSYLKRKAGLSEGFWSNDIKLSRYTVQKFCKRT